jgi:Copper transport outer membrane protein, MctB
VINFRYHVVSIVAVFLALAIGIVLGSTELRGTAFNALTRTSNTLNNELNAKKAQVSALNQLVNADEAFAQAAEPQLLHGLLAGQRVVLVSAPGAPGPVVSGLTSALRLAGATVTGQVSLQPKLLDASQSNQNFLAQLAVQLSPAGAQPASGTGLQQAAKLLGSAILTKSSAAGSATNTTPTSGQAVLASYAQAGLINGQPSVPATLAVVITPGSPPAGGGSDPANQGLITLALQLNSAGLGTVMAGSAAGSVAGSAIDALRAGNAGSQISSVDNADTTTGQVVAVWALQLALTGHKAGSYGVDPGNSGAVPSAAPVPSGAATAAVTGSGRTATSGGKPSGG